MKKALLRGIAVLLSIVALIFASLYFLQEKLIFLPSKLDKHFAFSFDEPFEELNLRTADGKLLNGLLFHAEKSKGLIFYLHGNAGALNSWGSVARAYTDLHYDVFILDYRGYGKSDGTITGENQLFDDVSLAYDKMKRRYPEEKIVVLGYSIGTGPAAWLASENKPRLLILQAPYYSLTDLMKHKCALLPGWLLKYKFSTDRYLGKCTMPVVIFHGDRDEVIYYNSSVKLREDWPAKVTLIRLKNEGHNGMTENPDYRLTIDRILK